MPRWPCSEIERIDEYLSAAQVGITMASIGLGFLGEPAIAQLLEPLFGNNVSHGVAVAISVTIAYLFVTAGHVIVGEQAPKIMAITHPETVARGSSRPLEWFRVGFYPVIWALNAGANFVLRRILRVDVDALQERPVHGRAADDGRARPGRGGPRPRRGRDAEGRLQPPRAAGPAGDDADAGARDGRPRDTVETGASRCIGSGHTRLVVVEDGNPDRVKGIVHANRLAQALMSEGADAPLAPLVREALIMPETKPLDDLLTDMRRQRSSLAVIVDEFGRTVGIVTIEDIIEEIVGEITDETDPVLSSIRKLVNGDWFVRGHVSLDDLADAGLDLHVDSDDYTTVGGFVFDELGRLPKRGDVIRKNGDSIRVESVRENRVEAVRIHPEPEPAPRPPRAETRLSVREDP